MHACLAAATTIHNHLVIIFEHDSIRTVGVEEAETGIFVWDTTRWWN